MLICSNSTMNSVTVNLQTLVHTKSLRWYWKVETLELSSAVKSQLVVCYHIIEFEVTNKLVAVFSLHYPYTGSRWWWMRPLDWPLASKLQQSSVLCIIQIRSQIPTGIWSDNGGAHQSKGLHPPSALASSASIKATIMHASFYDWLYLYLPVFHRQSLNNRQKPLVATKFATDTDSFDDLLVPDRKTK